VCNEYCTPRRLCRYHLGIDEILRCRPQAAFTCARVAGCRSSFAAGCDRGQIYCDGDCSLAARQSSVREAGRRYQRSRKERLAHAERMRRHRTRLNKVTHQGSAAAAADALLQATSTTSAKATTPGIARRLPAHCHFCQRACSALVRLGPLRTRVFQHVRTATNFTGHDP
jgi:hypothetical protein